jgi:PTH1 family peptidyl-tRNA hydrolase
VSEGLLGKIRGILSPSPSEPEELPVRPRIRLIVGIGNPGKEYAGNRHNVGYWTVNRVARRHGIDLDAGHQASIGHGTIGAFNVTLAKPRTFVNQSGLAIAALVDQLKLDDARELLIVYDELDLPVGKVRLRARGGSAGQKGMQSIIDAVHSDAFARLRIGIGRPLVQGKPSWDPEAIGNYVLSDPPAAERDLLDEAVERAIAAIELAVTDGIDAAMQKYN